MAWQLSPYTVPLLMTAAVLFAFAGYLANRSRERQGAALAGTLLVTAGFWTVVYAMQVSQTSLEASVVLGKVGYLSIAVLPVLWLGYVCQYTGCHRWASTRRIGVLASVSVFFALAAATNEAHWLFWRAVDVRAGGVPTLDVVYGPVFWLLVGYVYALVFTATLLLANAGLDTRGVLRWQVFTLLFFSLVPAASGGLYVLGYRPLPGINFAPLSMIVTVLVGGVGALRFRWLDLEPVDRGILFDAMAEAALVVDDRGYVADYNATAADRFGSDLLGRPVAEFAARLAEVSLSDDAVDRRELVVPTAAGERTFLVTATSPADGRSTLLLLHDVTEHTRAENRLAEKRRRTELLLSVVQRFAAADSEEAVLDETVDAARTLLEADYCRFFVRRDGEWAVAAATDTGSDRFADLLSADIARRVAASGRTHVVDDLSVRGGAAASTAPAAPTAGPEPVGPASTPTSGGAAAGVETDGESAPALEERFDSLLTVPVSDVGVVQAFADERGAFDDVDAEAAELLVSHVVTAVERTSAESELRRERDRLDEFASVVSHDLRNPLTVAQGYLELARAEPDDAYFDRVETAHDRMENLIEDLLSLARHGDTIGETAAVDLRRATVESWGVVDAPEASLEIEGELGETTADEMRLGELLANAFRNSVEHGGADVTVRVGREGRTLYVEDDGPGVPADVRRRAFDRGYTTAEEGTGYGLAIVRSIADAHGWSVGFVEGRDGGARLEIDGL